MVFFKMIGNLDKLPLLDLAVLYFKELLKEYGRHFDIIEPPPEVKKRKLLSFILFIRETGERWGCLIKDWKRSIGSDLIIRFKRVIDYLQLTSGIIIGNRISELALDQAKRYKLIAITRGEIISYLYSRGVHRKPDVINKKTKDIES